MYYYRCKHPKTERDPGQALPGAEPLKPRYMKQGLPCSPCSEGFQVLGYHMARANTTPETRHSHGPACQTDAGKKTGRAGKSPEQRRLP